MNTNYTNTDLFKSQHLTAKTTYILGYLINIVKLQKGTNYLKFKITNNNIIALLKQLLHNDILEIKIKKNYYNIVLKSDEITTDFLNILSLPLTGTDKLYNDFNISLIRMPNLYNLPISSDGKKNINLFWNFICGYLDNNAYIDFVDNKPNCIINFTSLNLLKDFHLYIKIPHIKLNNSIIFQSTNVIDFLGEIYKNNNYYSNVLYNKYLNLINWKYIHFNNFNLDICRIIKSDINAILPSKHYESDVGYDLTIIKPAKQLTPSTILYDTGLQLDIDYGYYVEIVPRSSLSKSGYILSNSIGIIEKSYSGNLYVALTKIDKEMPDLTLPFRCCQLIFRPQISLKLIHSNSEILKTSRNNGGFGSSN